MGLDYEDPYTHLSTFYELTATMGFEERDKEAAYMKLFPFSFAGKAKDWLNSHPNQSLRRWSKVEEKFLQKFFLYLGLSKPNQIFQISAREQMKLFAQHGIDSKPCCGGVRIMD